MNHWVTLSNTHSWGGSPFLLRQKLVVYEYVWFLKT